MRPGTQRKTTRSAVFSARRVAPGSRVFAPASPSLARDTRAGPLSSIPTTGYMLRMTLPLSGLLVVSLEQAVAAPMCTCRLADAGARVIKIERPEGDFARYYDDARARRLLVFRLAQPRQGIARASISRAPTTRRCSPPCSRRADVFVQNLKPGAVAKLGFPIERLRRRHPRLIVCSISGYGEDGPYAARKAYDMLIQAEFGARLDHRRPGGAGARRRLGLRHRRRHERLRGDPRGADRARAHRRGRRDLDLDVRRHGRLDGDAAAAARGRRAAAAHRARPHLDRALRRVQDPRRRRHSDLDPERPRVARAGRAGAGRRGARRAIPISPPTSSG